MGFLFLSIVGFLMVCASIYVFFEAPNIILSFSLFSLSLVVFTLIVNIGGFLNYEYTLILIPILSLVSLFFVSLASYLIHLKM